ncbi:MAG: short-chain dehydrogenase [Verrucomicrobia bacterium]|nr:MAG: short-chain dehydrogenase [Verrucomicrobiota bacterium]
MASMETRTCVITGATSGIGRAAARALGSMGANLVLIGRNERAGAALVDLARRRSWAGRVEFIRTDLSVQNEVRALAQTIIARHECIDILINNAGARFDRYEESVDGIEMTFATNHLSHFLLTCLLLDRLARAPEGRVITVGSRSHAAASVDSGWRMEPGSYDRRLAYARSKLANILFACELADRLGQTKVTSNAVDPGMVATRFAKNNGRLSRLELVLPRKGAETIVHLAASEEVKGISGKYFYRKTIIDSSAASRDREAARRLWSLSEEMTGLVSEND